MTLEREMRQVLAELELLSHGKATAWDASGGKAESRPPSGWTASPQEPLPPHLLWANAWERDPSQDTVDAARKDLKAWKKRDAPAKTDDSTLEDWILQDGEGYAVAQVATKFGVAEARVRRIRMKAGRESEFGQVVDHRVEKDRSDERVAYLADRGCSWREVAAQTGLHKTQVQRILARRRNAA